MGATWRRLLLAIAVGPGCVGVVSAAPAGDPPRSIPLPRPRAAVPAPASAPAAVKVPLPPLPPHVAAPVGRPATATRPAPAPEAAKPESAAATATAAEAQAQAQADPAADRAAAKERLEALPADTDKDATAATKALREVFKARLDWLDQWDKATRERADAEHPKSTPEEQATAWKAELERIQATLGQADRDPDALIPTSFRNLPAEVPEKVQNELKEAIDSAQTELKDWSEKHEQFRSEPSRKDGNGLAAIRAARDKQHQIVGGLKSRATERETALADAKTPETRALARERLLNFQWEGRVETERLNALEARLALETKRSELAAVNLQVLEAHVRLAQQTLDQLKGRYRTIAARQERDLRIAADAEKSRSKRADDPLEKFRARRTSELLELEARVLAVESMQATGTSPTLEEQRALADRAATDLANVKKLLDDGRISHLEALRLNNDFRRIRVDRARIVRNELAVAATRLSAAEASLSEVEVELAYDARDDRFELDTLLERLPPAQHPKAVALFDELERKHVELLARRRVALEKLARRAEETHEEILRRLQILDDHFGFIRTNLFWVRDQEPIGMTTVAQVQRESRQLARAGTRLGEQLLDTKGWGRVSPEFLSAALGLVVLPWPLWRLRRTLRSFDTRRRERAGSA
jgi:hypothetical protein